MEKEKGVVIFLLISLIFSNFVNAELFESGGYIFNETYYPATIPAGNVTVDESTEWQVIAEFVSWGTANYTNLKLGYFDLNVTDGTGSPVSFTNGTTWVSFEANESKNNYTISWKTIPITEMNASSCPHEFYVNYGKYCRYVTTETDKVNYYYASYLNNSDNDTKDYVIIYKQPIDRFTDFSSRQGLSVTINDSSWNISTMVDSNYFYIIVGTNHSNSSLEEGTYVVRTYYYVPRAQTTSGGGGGGGFSITGYCGDGICQTYLGENSLSCPQDCAMNQTFFVLPKSGKITRFLTPGVTYKHENDIILLNPNPQEIEVEVRIECIENDPSCNWIEIIGEFEDKIIFKVPPGTKENPGRTTVPFIVEIPKDVEIKDYEARFVFISQQSKPVVFVYELKASPLSFFDNLRDFLLSPPPISGKLVEKLHLNKIPMIVYLIFLIVVVYIIKIFKKERIPWARKKQYYY